MEADEPRTVPATRTSTLPTSCAVAHRSVAVTAVHVRHFWSLLWQRTHYRPRPVADQPRIRRIDRYRRHRRCCCHHRARRSHRHCCKRARRDCKCWFFCSPLRRGAAEQRQGIAHVKPEVVARAAKMWCLVSQANSVILEVQVDPKAIGQECLEKVCARARARIPVCARAFVFLLTICVLDSRRNITLNLAIYVNVRLNADLWKHAYSACFDSYRQSPNVSSSHPYACDHVSSLKTITTYSTQTSIDQIEIRAGNIARKRWTWSEWNRSPRFHRRVDVPSARDAMTMKFN